MTRPTPPAPFNFLILLEELQINRDRSIFRFSATGDRQTVDWEGVPFPPPFPPAYRGH